MGGFTKAPSPQALLWPVLSDSNSSSSWCRAPERFVSHAGHCWVSGRVTERTGLFIVHVIVWGALFVWLYHLPMTLWSSTNSYSRWAPSACIGISSSWLLHHSSPGAAETGICRVAMVLCQSQMATCWWSGACRGEMNVLSSLCFLVQSADASSQSPEQASAFETCSTLSVRPTTAPWCQEMESH